MSEAGFDAVFTPTVTTAATAKEQIGDFVKQHHNTTVDELLVFFSGHGDIIDDDFRYILSDFNDTEPNATTISNTQLDGWARSLAPDLFIKIVDACHSGTRYIKDGSALSKLLEATKPGFNNCYFFFSSLQNQSSFGSTSLSSFTAAIVYAIAHHKADSIGYYDLAGALRDRFLDQSDQTPYFVHQARLTEQFLTIGPTLREKLLALATPSSIHLETIGHPAESKALSLVERVELDSRSYTDKQAVLGLLDLIRKHLEGGSLPSDLRQLYSTSLEDIYSVESSRSIASWLTEQPKGQYFVRILYEEFYEDYLGNRVEKQPTDILAPGMFRKRSIVDDYELLEEGQWKALRLVAQPMKPNIPKWHLEVTYALGGTKCAVFYATQRLDRCGFTSYQWNGKTAWKVREVLADSFAAIPEDLWKVLGEDINKTLNDLFPENPTQKKS